MYKCKSFVKLWAINSSANIKLSKPQISKIKSCGFLGRPLGSLKIGLPLTNNVLRPLAKSFWYHLD